MELIIAAILIATAAAAAAKAFVPAHSPVKIKKKS